MATENDKEQQGKGFTVQDRRRFSESGEVRQESQEQPQAASASDNPIAGDAAKETAKRDETQALPEINLSTFIISLSTQALMHLGEIANPLTGQIEVDTAVAKQMIDIIGMLREKTRGNLNAGEDRLIEDILFDLRMKYVEAVKKK
jgi:Domain of unknown function (DUF1844)